MKQQLTEQELLSVYRGFYVLGDEASLKILYELVRFGEKTFTELKTELDINPATLTKKLRILTVAGIVMSDRTRDHLHVYYFVAPKQPALTRFISAFERLAHDFTKNK